MKRFLPLLLFVIPFVSNAQSNFRAGYVITNTNDTLKGYVNYRERSNNLSSLQFKTGPDAGVQVFTVENSRGYGIDNVEKFQRYLIDISMGKVVLSDLSTGPDNSSRRDSVFLRVIQEGDNIDLYTYEDNLKNRFYIRENTKSVPEELVYQRYLNPDNVSHTITRNTYTRQLFVLSEKYRPGAGVNSETLKGLSYSERDISKIIAQINKQEIARSNYSATRFFIGTGVGFSSTHYGGQNDLANAASSNKSSISPIITVGADLFGNPAIGKLIYRLEVSVVQSKNNISTTTDNQAQAILSHQFNQYTAMVVPQIIYNLYNTTPLKIFVGAGFGLNFSKYSNNRSSRYNSFRDETTVTENQVSLELFSSSIPMRAGVVLNKRVEISGIFTPSSAITNYNSYNISVQRYAIALNYLFGN